ncbi:MAG: YdcF family protein [Oscillospiraceae bacterium]|nr:YdcF family protein [Oscillospiraceae bacterium]
MRTKHINKKWFRFLKITFYIGLALALLGSAILLGINLWVTESVKSNIINEQQAAKLQDVDCIIVLGCQVRDDGTPSHMLEDRLRRGVSLYDLKAAPKLLMSGDHGTEGYDEVDAMKHYAVDAGVPSADVFMDHAGFSTYDTVCRAKEIFQAQKVIIVTQTYHLYRAMYIAKQIGLEAYGVAAEYRQYGGQLARDIREVLARVKDFGMSILQPEPVYLGEAIPISGNGELTHDDKSNFS